MSLFVGLFLIAVLVICLRVAYQLRTNHSAERNFKDHV